MATRSNRVLLGPRPQGVAEGVGDEEELADVDEEEAAGEARDVTMAKTETETATRTATAVETEIETGALATND
jgi:predicted RNA-binding protein associated with RNAse of E/G family